MADRRAVPGRRRTIPTAVMWSVAAVAVALSLFLGSVFALNLNLVHLRESFGWVQHTDEVLLGLAGIEAKLIEAESAERGYLLTGDADYLAPFERAQAELGKQFDGLVQLSADNPGQLKRIEELRPLVVTRMAEFKRAIDLGPSRLQDALAGIRAAKERRLTQAAQEQIEAARERQVALRSDRLHEAENASALSTAIAACAGILSLASAGLGLFLFMRSSARQSIRELQSELMHVSRLNTMGQTASMIAHEINQPLTAMRNYLQGTVRMLEAVVAPPPEKVKETLRKALAQVERAADIVGRLRRFVERHDTDRQAEALDSVIDDALALMAIDPERVTVRRLVQPELPAVMVDRIEVQQVLINLMRNGAEPMAGSPRRELTLEADLVAVEGEVRVSIRDTGPGLPPQVAQRLFQPFNSTKEEGMGIGLSICRTIVERFGGRIWAVPNPEGGTIFCFTLPIAAARRAA